MKENLTKLIKVKTIVTLLLVIVFCFLSLKGTVPVEEFIKILTIIIVFYFAKKGETTND